MARPHVVIIGGGFGGLYAARGLVVAPVRVTLVDRVNHHLFQPLLYEVATAALSPADIAEPIRRIFHRHRNVRVLLGAVVDIDVPGRRVRLADGGLDWDLLVLAAGVTHSYFGHDTWAAHAPGLKTAADAIEIRRRFLLAFEAAERETDEDARRARLTFVVVGAGPTGVELAGTMSEIARRALPRDFRAIDTTSSRVVLVEGCDRVLPTFSPSLSAKARRHLEALGVEVRTGCRVTSIDAGGVTLGDERIESGNVVWAAGVRASPLGASLGTGRDDGRERMAGPAVVSPHVSDLEVRVPVVDGQVAQPVLEHEQALEQGQTGRHVAPTLDLHQGAVLELPLTYLMRLKAPEPGDQRFSR